MTELVISRSALLTNFTAFSNLAGGSEKILPVIKANAYGHGAAAVAKIIGPLHPRGFGVASSTEAVVLRKQGIRDCLLILSYWQENDIPKLLRTRTEFVVWDFISLGKIARLAEKKRVITKVHVKIDTGASRIGIRPGQLPLMLSEIKKMPYLKISGVFSHFSDAESPGLAYTKKQWGVFSLAARNLPKDIAKHISCTASSLRYRVSQASFLRLGIGLYGYYPSVATKKAANGLVLCPALSWKTIVLQAKVVPKGTPIGYGRSFVTGRATQIAVLPVGYADGYDRGLSNSGFVLIRGKRCRIIGRVCMNLTMVDASSISRLRAGEPVVLIGRQGRVAVSAQELAERAGTIHYELLSRLPGYLSRKYI